MLKIIDVFICKLRKKLANASSGKNYIEKSAVRRAPRPKIFLRAPILPNPSVGGSLGIHSNPCICTGIVFACVPS
jgi:hypothetical protein